MQDEASAACDSTCTTHALHAHVPCAQDAYALHATCFTHMRCRRARPPSARERRLHARA